MDKLRMESPDMVQGNVEKLAALFPNCVTEGPDGHGGLKKAIDFNKLRQMLSGDVLEGDEAYEFTWVGKKAAMVEANKPTRQTLRPCPEESKNWDTTENLYIEGDNLQVLKLLQESYLGKVKMIYIDPPYNSRQYCDAYHLLENVARWEKPEVFGVAKKMDRSGMKSRYCTAGAAEAFEALVGDIRARYILLSYNNMAEKGNSRSNAKISDEDILRILRQKGVVKVFSESYKPFTTGRSDIEENAERLFLCTCYDGA